MKRSKFSLSHYKLLSCDMGVLVPIGLMEVLPGDTIQQASTAFIRFAPMLSPPMHPVHCRIHHWYVPHRLVWDSWENFITGGPDGLDASVFPTITAAGGFAAGGLHDYLGIPPSVANTVVSALPARGYNLIWNEHYRDQDLQTSIPISTASGNDTTTGTGLQSVCWEKDYFTTSRPWEQKGPVINVPISYSATQGGPTVPRNATTGAAIVSATGFTSDVGGLLNANPGAVQADMDVSSTHNVSIKNLRQAFAMQRWEEHRARFGSRYTEYLRALGVRSSDARLQRPEYLGGGKQTIQFSEVLQTAEGTNPVGQLRGHGINATRSNRYRRYFEEHGYVHSFINVKPKSIYTQGIERHWNRRVKEDFWQPELQFIGQQIVKNKELYSAHSSPEGTFGYQDRYDEYRRAESLIGGEFRSSVLNYWHFARIFSSDTALNATFVSCTPPVRPFASATNDVLYIMCNHSIQARRMVARSAGNSRVF